MKGAIVMSSPKMLKEDEKINGFDRWDVKSSMEALARAKRIKEDKKLMEAIGILAKERLEEMAHVIAHVEQSKDDKK